MLRRTRESHPRSWLVFVAAVAALVAGVAACGSDSNSASSPPDPACVRECNAIANAHCSDANCVAECENTRAGRAACIAQDTAYRDCFATSSIVCTDGGAIVGSSICTAQSTALDNCLSPDGGA